MRFIVEDFVNTAAGIMCLAIGVASLVMALVFACSAAKAADPNAHWSDGYILLASNFDYDEDSDTDSDSREGNGPPGGDIDIDIVNEGDTITGGNIKVDTKVKIEEGDRNVIVVPKAEGSSTGCDTSGASVGVKAGGLALSFPTYPCEIERTYDAIEHTLALDEDGERKHGFFTGKLPRFFLRVRLLTKGFFSAVAGLIGLG